MADKYRAEFELLAEKLAARGLDVDKIKARLKDQKIETPSWGYSNAGTRFGTFRQDGAAFSIEEKVADAAQIHKFTGVAPTVAVHVLWDFPNGIDDCKNLKSYAESLGVKIGAINPNVFQNQAYAFGSITSEDQAIRKMAIDHMIDSVEIGKMVGSDVLSLWFADGTDYPGQGDFRRRKQYATESLRAVYNAMPANMRMVLEYKPFEPGFYHTDIADWGMSYNLCQKCGDRAHVLVDLGHHLQGTNIEHIVAFLLDEERLGGFHFNNHKYADDDLTVGSINPYELFLIYNELAKAEDAPNNNPPVAYMVDQCHISKQRLDAMIQTVEHIQTAYAKALCIDRHKLYAAQLANDIVSAETCMTEAFNTDVSPLLKVVREEMGIDPNPLEAFRASGYWAKVSKERAGRKGGGGVGA